MKPTQLYYLDKPFLYAGNAQIVGVDQNNQGKTRVILDRTLFYPQGGGQSYDQGTIHADGKTFHVQEVRFSEGIVYHVGTFYDEQFQIGDKVYCTIDEERRKLHCRLHSGGHLVDCALTRLGHTGLIPSKGYHFPDGSYVQYEGVIPEGDRENIRQHLEEEIEKLIHENAAVEMRPTSRKELEKLCHHVPDFLPEGKPARVVLFCLKEGDWGMPCGGTHVHRLGEIGSVSIPKIIVKKGHTKIFYHCE